MSVLTDSAQKTYTGDGTTGPYPITFPVLYDDGGNAEDITVTKVTIATGAEEDITATSTIAGLNVTLAAAASSDYYIVLSRVPDFTQEDGYTYLNAIPSETIERALDKLTMMAQWLKNRLTVLTGVITTPVATFIDALGASATLTTLGFSDFFKTLVDDSDGNTVVSTILSDVGTDPIDIGGPVGIVDAHNDAYALTLGAGGLLIKAGEPLTFDGLSFRAKQIDIGTWDMDATATKLAIPGIAANKVFLLTAAICDDAYPTIYRYFASSSNATGDLLIQYANDGTTISITRLAGGAYDSAGFDSTAFSRGYINVLYFE